MSVWIAKYATTPLDSQQGRVQQLKTQGSFVLVSSIAYTHHPDSCDFFRFINVCAARHYHTTVHNIRERRYEENNNAGVNVDYYCIYR